MPSAALRRIRAEHVFSDTVIDARHCLATQSDSGRRRSRSGLPSGRSGDSRNKPRYSIGTAPMMAIRHAAKQPKGLAFEIDDLLRMREWADHQGVHMVVRLDHGLDREEYEEVVAFHANPQASCFLLIWRSVEAIIVQSLVGRPKAYR